MTQPVKAATTVPMMMGARFSIVKKALRQPCNLGAGAVNSSDRGDPVYCATRRRPDTASEWALDVMLSKA